MTNYLDTHQICKNASWYEYGMNYNYEAKHKTASKVSHYFNHLFGLFCSPSTNVFLKLPPPDMNYKVQIEFFFKISR